MYFIDVFAGCGGLSLGMMEAGLTGIAAIEKNPMAFETLRHNLIDGESNKFEWPQWLPKKAMTCEEFLANHSKKIVSLKGKVQVLVGGPPCQGFSTAGKRNPEDPRNQMASKYLELVKLLLPEYLVIENVSGFNIPFRKKNKPASAAVETYADYICGELKKLGYDVSRGKVNCADFGIPQNRLRYIIFCSRTPGVNMLEVLLSTRNSYKEGKGLNAFRPTSVYEAIADLETEGRRFVQNREGASGTFREAEYQEPDIYSPFLSLMKKGARKVPNSRRLPNHKPSTILHFLRIKMVATPGKSLSKSTRETLGIKKHAITMLSKELPSPTITTLPDDILHYSEPRILTVRESARLQSFPDWFEFTGKYTTGGQSRKIDCPRYTQVGNAVPPMLGEAIGRVILAQENQGKGLKGEKYGISKF